MVTMAASMLFPPLTPELRDETSAWSSRESSSDLHATPVETWCRACRGLWCPAPESQMHWIEGAAGRRVAGKLVALHGRAAVCQPHSGPVTSASSDLEECAVTGQL